jgi:hypothetical protein
MAFLAPLAAVVAEGGAEAGVAAGAAAEGGAAAAGGGLRAGLSRFGVRALMGGHNRQAQRNPAPQPGGNAMGTFEAVMQPHQF